MSAATPSPPGNPLVPENVTTSQTAANGTSTPASSENIADASAVAAPDTATKVFADEAGERSAAGAHLSATAPSPAEVSGLVAANASVVELLGESAGISFRRACGLSLSSSPMDASGEGSVAEGERLTEATRLFVELLQQVPEDKQGSAGFAELLLAYGKSLLSFVRRSGATAAVLGDAVEKEEGGASAAEAGNVAQEEDVEEEDEEELAWTQLETSRVVFSALVKEEGGKDKYGERLGGVHATLGDLLLEGDIWDGAAREYDSAAQLLHGRRRAEALYKRYLALRRDQAEDAVKALRDSVATFESVRADEDTLRDLREELAGFEEAVLPALRRVVDENRKVEVTVVQPRKRAKPNQERGG